MPAHGGDGPMPVLTDGTVFEQHGPRNGPTIVLVHGLGLRRDLWQGQLPALTQRYHVIVYDLYGHGDSGDPAEEPSLSVFSHQLLRVLDACDVRQAAVVGFSLGGMIARRFAQDHPERISAMAILHSPHRRSSEAQAAIAARVEQARQEGAAATVSAALERWFTQSFREAYPDVIQRVRQWVLANDIPIYHCNYSVLADGVEEILAPNPSICTPTLVMTADEDYGNSPEMARAISAEVRGAETVILTGLRHMALVEDPDSTTRPLLSFFERHLRASGHDGVSRRPGPLSE